jgi:two-component system cell cycle response regulator CtrA
MTKNLYLVMKVLLIEDHQPTALAIRDLLESNTAGSPMHCDICDGGESALQTSQFCRYDLVIIDLMLPDMNGFEVLTKIRSFSNAPILILSAQKEVSDKVKTLGFGADDYMTKPFSGEELVARIKALIRRSEGNACSIIKVGDLTLNLDRGTLEAGGVPLQLTSKEYKIIELLMQRKGVIVTKTAFLDKLYSGIDEPEEKIIDVFVCKIRRKLDEFVAGGRHYIETIWGRGYILQEPPANLREKGFEPQPVAPVI